MSLLFFWQRESIIADCLIAKLLAFTLIEELFSEYLLVEVFLVWEVILKVFENLSVVALGEDKSQPGIVCGIFVGDNARGENLGELGLLGALDDDVWLFLLFSPVKLSFAALSRSETKIACWEVRSEEVAIVLEIGVARLSEQHDLKERKDRYCYE